MEALNPAAEFAYNPRVRELFADLQHAGVLPAVGATHASPCDPDALNGDACLTPEIVTTEIGSREQGASIQLQIALQGARITVVRYQAYGCPHFLAACESLARWLEGQAISALSQWHWRELETELKLPTAKRARLLLLDDVLQKMRGRLGASPSISDAG